MEKYIIGEVLNNETKERDEQFGYRVGRECMLYGVRVGLPAVAIYNNGSGWRSSTVQSIEETDYGMWVITLNRSYRFDRVSF